MIGSGQQYFNCRLEIEIIHQNIRSIRQNFNSFLITLSNLKNLPSIIILSEIWINSNESQFYEIEGYNLKTKCNDEYRAGGVAIYVKNSIDIIECLTVPMVSADVLNIKINLFDQICNILAVYRTHLYAKEYFINELEQFYNANNNLRNLMNIIFIGDINIDLLEHSNVVDNYKLVMAVNGFMCLNEQATRITEQSSTSIDHVFVKIVDSDKIEIEAGVVDANVTDHCMLHVSLFVRGSRGEGTGQTSQPAYRVDNTILNRLLDNLDWASVYNTHNASTAYENFYIILKGCLESSKVEILKKSNSRKIKPWINNYICTKIKFRNKIFHNLRKHPQNKDLRNYYTQFRNKLQKEIRQLKNSYYQRKLNECNNNPKKVWNLINEITCQRKKQNQSFSINLNGEIIKDPQCVANAFNDFFLNIVENLNLNTDISENIMNSEFRNIFININQTQSIFIQPIMKTELENIIKSLKNGTAPGIDGVNSSIIKSIYPKIINPLLYIVNLSFETGIFPDLLKNAVVIPIYKGGQSICCSNFRPISLLSTFSKIFEKIMKDKLMNFLGKTNFFSDNQFGYRNNLSTENALQHFMHDVYNGLNDGSLTTGLFLDIRKAFDTVDHKIMLEKLHTIGIRGVVYNWFESYLINRKQCVRVEHYISDMKCIYQGVPQGSVLGAILFLIYINDFCNGKFKGKLTSFADDTALCYVESDLDILQYKINYDLEAIQWWFTKNHMLLNVEKTKYINFYLRKHWIFNDRIMYKCSNCLDKQTFCNNTCKEVGRVTDIKYLGLVVDQEINWKMHVNNLKSKLNISIRYFYFLKGICNERTLRMLYFSLVQSRIEYGMVFWCGTYSSHVNVLHIYQKSFIRLIKRKTKLEPSRPLFAELKILPLKFLFVYKVLKLFYNNSRYTPQQNIYKNKLRNREHILVPKPSYTFFTKSYNFLAPRIYNKLPDAVKHAKSKYIFFRKLKNWLNNLDDIQNVLIVES